MKEQAINQYQQNSVLSASPGELTLMLYNGCLKFIKQAEKALENNDHHTKNETIIKAQSIMTELMLTLNREVEISQQILPLYEYIHHKLFEANTKNDKEALNEAFTNVKELKDTWVQVLKMQKEGQLT
jgi:flagellar secretion chaperone FliS